MREKELTNLLAEPLSNKLDYCFSFGNERSRLDFCEDVLGSICGDYDADPRYNQAIIILERKLDERLIEHFREEI